MKKRKKKRKFRKIAFMLSDKQMKSLLNYCKARKTTPNKLIKKRLYDYTSNYSQSVPDKFFISYNQLDLFDKESDSL